MSQDHSRGGRGKERRISLGPPCARGFMPLSAYKWGQRSERFSVQPESHSGVITHQGSLTDSSKVGAPVISILQLSKSPNPRTISKALGNLIPQFSGKEGMPLRAILLDLHLVQHQTLLSRNFGHGMSQFCSPLKVRNAPPCIDSQNLSTQKEHEIKIIKNEENHQRG